MSTWGSDSHLGLFPDPCTISGELTSVVSLLLTKPGQAFPVLCDSNGETNGDKPHGQHIKMLHCHCHTALNTMDHNGNSPHCCSRGKRSCHRQDVQWSLFSVSLGLLRKAGALAEGTKMWQTSLSSFKHHSKANVWSLLFRPWLVAESHTARSLHSLLREFTLGPLAYLSP